MSYIKNFKDFSEESNIEYCDYIANSITANVSIEYMDNGDIPANVQVSSNIVDYCASIAYINNESNIDISNNLKSRLYHYTQNHTKTDYLYHGTCTLLKDDIINRGVKSTSHWTSNLDLAQYYAGKTANELNSSPLIIRISLSQFKKSLFRIDYDSIENPVSSVINKSVDEVWDEWKTSNKSWEDCLRITFSIKYTSPVIISSDDILI